jgi:hypothetical protein
MIFNPGAGLDVLPGAGIDGREQIKLIIVLKER